MNTGMSWVLVIIAVLVLANLVGPPLLHILYWLFASLSHVSFAVLDNAFAATFIPAAPWLMWLLWGAIVGACLGLWTLAPIYGWRKQRPLIMVAPLGLLTLIFFISRLVTR